jgi:hypothetical protein
LPYGAMKPSTAVGHLAYRFMKAGGTKVPAADALRSNECVKPAGPRERGPCHGSGCQFALAGPQLRAGPAAG